MLCLFGLSNVVMSNVKQGVVTRDDTKVYVQTEQGTQEVDVAVVHKAQCKFFRALSLLLRAGIALNFAINIAKTIVVSVLNPLIIPFAIIGTIIATFITMIPYWIADCVKYGDIWFDSKIVYTQYPDEPYFERKRKEFIDDFNGLVT